MFVFQYLCVCVVQELNPHGNTDLGVERRERHRHKDRDREKEARKAIIMELHKSRTLSTLSLQEQLID